MRLMSSSLDTACWYASIGLNHVARQQFEQRIVQRTHALFAAHLDETRQLLEFAFADVGAQGVAAHEDLQRGDTAAGFLAAQRLGHDTFEALGEAGADLLLFVGRETG